MTASMITKRRRTQNTTVEKVDGATHRMLRHEPVKVAAVKVEPGKVEAMTGD